MLFVYGTLMPLRILEEILLWKMQEKDHIDLIQKSPSTLEPQYIAWLSEWEDVLQKTINYTRYSLHTLVATQPPYLDAPPQQVDDLLNTAMTQSIAFINQLQQMMSTSPAIQQHPLSQIIIRHVIQQSEYFMLALEPAVHPTVFTHPAPRHREQTWSDYLTSTTVGQPPSPVPIGGHRLPPLPYAYDALEPHIDALTMQLHHDKHHQAYVDELNKAELALADMRTQGNYDFMTYWEGELAFNGAGHYLHTLFWQSMSPNGGGEPRGELLVQLQQDYGSFEQFKAHFNAAASKVEGNGWAMLVWSPRSGRTQLLQAEKHQNLSQWDVIPLLPLDVWEHAYYLKYQNKRTEYIASWWNVINWPSVAARYKQAKLLKWQLW